MTNTAPKKRYIKGNAWQKEGQYGTFYTISLKLEDLKTLPVDNYGNIKLVMSERRQPDEKSRATHYFVEDTYKPQQASQSPKNDDIDMDSVQQASPF